jgi:hypothetical protein
MNVAILDDYQNVALKMADWSSVVRRAKITVFNDYVADPDAVVERLLPFDVICVMPERTPLPRPRTDCKVASSPESFRCGSSAAGWR